MSKKIDGAVVVGEGGKTYDTFLTHDWGRYKSEEDGEEVHNHDRVSPY